MRKGDKVRDTAGTYGQGIVIQVESYGAQVQWDNGQVQFLGFGWLEDASAMDLTNIPDFS